MGALHHVVVVGASLAGFHAAETLRGAGFDGRVTLIGAEAHLPYDRPPLSKQVLTGEWTVERAVLRTDEEYVDLGLDFRLGVAATDLDLGDRRLVLHGGESIEFDAMVIATGSSPRTLPGAPQMNGIHLLRSLDDCLDIRSELEAGPRVVIVGAGFIGSEVASSARARGLDVTVLEALPVPLARVLGEDLGRVCGELHEDHGVTLRCGLTVAGFEGGSRVERVLLSDGTAIDADLVVVGVGVVPATEWLASSGLTVNDGVVCDRFCATAAPGVFAAGDVARWDNVLFGEHMRVEHWTNAVEQGRTAALNLLAGPDRGEPFAPVPYFWSDQYGLKLQLVGRTSAADDVAIVHGDVRSRRFVALYGRDGRLHAALAFGWPRMLAVYNRLVAAGTSWNDALSHASLLEKAS